MNFYDFHIGDYASRTAHLEPMEDLAYRRLLDLYYTREEALPHELGRLSKLVRLRGQEEAIQAVLSEFFELDEQRGWVHRKCEEVIHLAQLKKDKARAAAELSVLSRSKTAQENAVLRSARMAQAKERCTHTDAEWAALVHACGGTCVACGATGSLEKDHITPVYQDGSDGIENLQPLCRSCNAGKGAEAVDRRPANWQQAFNERLTDAQRTLNVGSAPSPSPSPTSQKKTGAAAPPPDGVSVSVWTDFLKTRKTKVTDTALKGIRREAEKAGFSLEAALQECCARGWQGFKADWVQGKARPADVSRVTVPGPTGRDPALQKLDEDAKKSVPIPLEQLERMAAIRAGKVTH